MGSSSDDSDETDEEERQRLQESVSGVNFELKTKKTTTDLEERSKKKSLRKTWHDDEGDNVLQTTPQFRKFVANKLDQYLESEINETDIVKEDASREINQIDKDEGIKLLHESIATVTEKKVHIQQKQKKKRKSYSSSSSSDENSDTEKFRSAAVTMDFIKTEAATYRKYSQENPDKILVISETKSGKKKKKRKKKNKKEVKDGIEVAT